MLFRSIKENLNALVNNASYYEISLIQDVERNWWLPQLKITNHGVITNIAINRDLFLSPDYRKMCEFGDKLLRLIKPGASIQREDKTQAIKSFTQAVQWLIKEAKRGQTIQRYKGLGEMNPDQLWETTMDPGTRSLLQVTVEDAVLADQMFTTLMGDEVEPRRQFIELNALDAVNIDV